MTWDPVTAMLRRGIITKYRIDMENILNSWETDEEKHADSFMRIDRNLFVEGLNNYTEYEICVTAYTEVGPGPTTDKIIFRTDENGKTKTMTYDANGNLTGVTHRDGATVAMIYNSAGQIASKTFENGVQNTFQYDSGCSPCPSGR